jgi:uncharacterized protein (DUF736 family)
MTQYDNTDTGALFKNERKETDKHPDYTGQLNVGGVDFWLSAWLKKDRNGRTYMSLSIKLKEDRAPVRGAGKQGEVYRTANTRRPPMEDSDPPF